MAKAQWTLMVYMAGDNNLSSVGDVDLAEMRQVGSTPEVNIVVQFDNAGNLGTRRFLIGKNGQGEKIEQLAETDSGDPGVLLDFIAWTAQNYPAERYALVLWNHGGGWEPSEMDRIARLVKTPNYNPREMNERSASRLRRAFFRTSLETIFRLQSPADRAICSDDGSGHSLDTVELGKVLEQAMQVLGQPIDLLGMDACLMSNLEVAYQTRSYAHYLVASEEEEPNSGWPYDKVLAKLIENPQMVAGDLAVYIVDAYVQSYQSGNSRSGPARDALVNSGEKPPLNRIVSQTALDLSKTDMVLESLNTLASLLRTSLPGSYPQIWNAQRKTEDFWNGTLWDLAQLCQNLEHRLSNSALQEAARKLGQALQAGSGKLILKKDGLGVLTENWGGLSIYLPPPGLHEISRYYQELAFAQDSKWLDWLKAYHKA